MKTNENVTGAKLIDLKHYKLPETVRSKKIIARIRSQIPRKEAGVNFDIYDYRSIFNDPATREIIRKGETIGCFYIESPGMRSLLRRLECDTFEMLTAASSIIRPGVAESGMMQEFIERHKNPSRRKYIVKEMEKYLSETYGVMVYQEDVIKIAHHVAGLSMEEADLLRRAMSGKMRSRDAMQKLKKRFFQACNARGLTPKTSGELWRQIESFAGYAFCKAHSASFAILSFQVAYLKAHYPAEFMAAVLSNGGGYYSASVYINEAKRMGLKILLPSINHSLYHYSGANGSIRIGLMAVGNLAQKSAFRIIEERKRNGKFVSLGNFLLRTGLRYKETATLIRCGAMDCFGKTRPALLRLLDVYFHYSNFFNSNQTDLFAGAEAFALEREIQTTRQYSIEEICSAEYEILGYMVSRHPLEFFTTLPENNEIIKSVELEKYRGKKVKILGWFMASKRIKTSKGKIMKFLSLEDLHGTFEVVLFPETYAKFAEKTLSMGPYLVEGKVELKNGRNIIAEHISILSDKDFAAPTGKNETEKIYSGEVENFSEEELALANTLGKENLRKAYLS